MSDKPIHVLLVEDNPADARLLQGILADAGPKRFAVSHVDKLSEALGRLRREQTCDVILLDLSLPDSQGLDTLSRTQAAAPLTPVVVLTGLDDESLGLDAIRIGAQDYLVKGRVDTASLARAIGYAAEREHLLEELRRARDELEQRVQERTADLRRTVSALQEEIIARQQAERAVAEQARTLEGFFAATINPIVFLDRDFKFIRVNEAYARACGREVAEFPGRNHFELYPSEELEGTFRRVVETKVAWQVFARPFIFPDHPDWGLTYWDLALVPVLDGNGEVEFLVFSLNDVTARKQAEDARTRLQGQLHQSQKMEAIGRLAAGLGHDFGNLLAVVEDCTARAKRSLHQASVVGEALQVAEDAARQARGIVESLLTFGCQRSTRREPVNLCAVMAESAYLLRHTLPKRVELAIRPCDPPLWVRGDPVQVEQVLLNLAINANDAMPDGGTIEISLAPVADPEDHGSPDGAGPGTRFARLTVRDTGVGIPPEIQPRIFEPFFTGKPRGQGTGLGLSIVHGIVQDMGGRIEVWSEMGKGTIFRIMLPCIEPPVSAKASIAQPVEVPRAQGEVVLLAGGTPHLRGVMGAALRLLGCEVMQANDESAVDACCDECRGRLDLIVIEREAFRGRGLDCLRRLRSSGVRTPAVVLCDPTDGSVPEPVDDQTTVLHKPFAVRELEDLVCELLGVP